MKKSVSIVIPTYGRNKVLLDTLTQLFDLEYGANETIIVDQTPEHDSETHDALNAWTKTGKLKWVRLGRPSIPSAMNAGLIKAGSDIVLFLDDDIVPGSNLVRAHVTGHADPAIWAVAGQVLQPGERPIASGKSKRNDGLLADIDFCFCSNRPEIIRNVMAGNLSVKRSRAVETGGFDQNFVGVAYRFETEFARRIHRAGGKILFRPEASVRHLRSQEGGTRSCGSHLTSASPVHGVGDYYFALRQGNTAETVAYMAVRPLREVRTRFHLKHPWYIPVKLIGELRAFCLAVRLNRKGPLLLEKNL